MQFVFASIQMTTDLGQVWWDYLAADQRSCGRHIDTANPAADGLMRAGPPSIELIGTKEVPAK